MCLGRVSGRRALNDYATDEGRWDIPKEESLYNGSVILPTFIPPFEASDHDKNWVWGFLKGCSLKGYLQRALTGFGII